MLAWIAISCLIGAVIGGFTNLIAIRMLFRPYKPWRLGSWKLPFTPGLIPKRQPELANQIGQLVTTHLLTNEGIKGALEERLKQRIREIVLKKVEQGANSDKSVQDIAECWLTPVQWDAFVVLVDNRSKDAITNLLKNILNNNEFREKSWSEWFSLHIPSEWESTVKVKLIEMLQQGMIAFVNSGGLKQPLQGLITQVTGGGQGMFGKLAAMFVDEEKISTMVEPQLIQYLEKEEIKNQLMVFIDSEWEKLKQEKIGVTLDRANVFDSLTRVMEQILVKTSVTGVVWKTPIKNILSPLIVTIAPVLEDILQRGWEALLNQLEKALEVMQLDQVVKSQVMS
ncbi:MAG: DUF445 family protein, partial [Bacilli bacterium]